MIFIRKYGIKKFIEQQSLRIRLLETMLKDYNDARSKSFYCIATTLLPIKDLKISLDESEQKIRVHKIKTDDLKTKSKILKEYLNNFATKEGIELKLRKKNEN